MGQAESKWCRWWVQEGEVVRVAAVDVVRSHEAFFSNILLTATSPHTPQPQLEEAELTTALLARVGRGRGSGAGWQGGEGGLQRRCVGLRFGPERQRGDGPPSTSSC